ncbi:MAG TPA: glycoside hydrolase family 3 C-terminal domain-containing protein [Chryseolinea sp.]
MAILNNRHYFVRSCLTPFVVVVLLLVHSCATDKQPKQDVLPYLNPELPIDQRVDDLVSRMTLEEKISQMINQAPAIERLGVPEYNWWSEGLHGVARAGLATVFPQAIGLGATWDRDLMFRVSTAISEEARAKHHEFARKGKRFIYQGLTLWSPNINIFRDPRWGRGQETYGEDPFLTGRLAVEFIKGLQGDDSVYYKTIATVKHFAVHSGPEIDRHTFNAVTGNKDLYETYLPQFEVGIREGGAYSLMCAYNRYNGEACCTSGKLLDEVLRKDWAFSGFVVSDCDGIVDIYKNHKQVTTPAEAAALAVKSGTDLECGKVYLNLKEAVEKNLITEKEIDVSVKRLFKARFKLGMFDPPEMVKYANIPYSVVDNKEHRKLALEAAHKSIVLLKNENNTLPLKKDIKNLAVIGPNADQWLMLLGNYNGVPADPITPLRGIREKVKNTNVLYAQGCELATGMPTYKTIPAHALFNGANPGIKAEYFNNTDFSGSPLFGLTDSEIDKNWSDKAPRNDMNDDNFSVRWSGELVPDKTASYQLGFVSTCNTRLYLDDSLVAKTIYHFRDEYGDPRLRKSPVMKLEAGRKYKIVLEAIDTYADAQVQLVWTRPQPDLKQEAIDVAKKADAVVMFMGLTARMEGEEMDITIDGFSAGDRTRIDLPDTQQDLIKSIHALGKPVVVVLLNGSALAVNWESKNVPAILEAWYPGQAAGQAIADVIFGDYNPGGRLPVTFYKSTKDLPSFKEYNLVGQTYRYFKGEPLYPFGHGLSYTTFEYSDLKINDTQKAGDSVKVSVSLKNTGQMKGDEVVQVYVRNLNAPAKAPLLSLAEFKRISLAPAEVKQIDFTLAPGSFLMMNDDGESLKAPGRYEIAIGGAQPGGKHQQGLKSIIELQ